MSAINAEGVRMLHGRSSVLAVNSMDDAERVIGKAIAERDARIAAATGRETDDTVAFGRHLAWLVGFDHLINDRKAIQNLTKFIVDSAP